MALVATDLSLEQPGGVTALLQPPMRQVMGNTAVQIAIPVARMLLGLVLVAALSRYLGVAGLGEYGLVVAYVALFNGIFNDVGLGTICLREIVQRPAERAQITYAAATLQLVVAGIAYAILVLSLLLAPYPTEVRISAAILGLSMAGSAVEMLALPFQAELKMAKLLAPSVATAALGLALALVVIARRGSLEMLVAAMLGALLVQYAWIGALSVRRLGLTPVRPRREWAWLVRKAMPLGISTVISTLVQQGPVFALSLFNLREVGIFVAASKAPQQLVILPLAVRGTTFPILASAWATARAHFVLVMRRLIRGSILIAVPLGVFLIGISERFVTIVFGTSFLSATRPLVILLAVSVMLFPGILIGEALIAAGLQHLTLILTAACFPVLVITLAVLVPKAGASGAAGAVLAFQVALFTSTWLAGRKYLGRAVPVVAVVQGLAAGVCGLIVLAWFAQVNALFGATLGALFALAVLALLFRPTLKTKKLVVIGLV
jgi:O-antigen/teichoic acid export membrane protein